VDDATIDEVAREVRTTERTVMRRLLGLPVRGRVGIEIDLALSERGLGSEGGHDAP